MNKPVVISEACNLTGLPVELGTIHENLNPDTLANDYLKACQFNGTLENDIGRKYINSQYSWEAVGQTTYNLINSIKGGKSSNSQS